LKDVNEEKQEGISRRARGAGAIRAMLVRGAQKADLRLRADWRIILSRESWQNLAEWGGL
jgi:hypothetical protein